jgi:hypothetical protein
MEVKTSIVSEFEGKSFKVEDFPTVLRAIRNEAYNLLQTLRPHYWIFDLVFEFEFSDENGETSFWKGDWTFDMRDSYKEWGRGLYKVFYYDRRYQKWENEIKSKTGQTLHMLTCRVYAENHRH